jgi:Carbohydrate family 9 binding domain-like
MKVSRLALVVISSMVLAAAQEQSPLESVKSDHDAVLDTNPGSAFWSGTRPTYAEVDANGRRMPEYLTEVRSRWTKDNLYFLFICPYKNLSLKPAPDTARETYELWKWNVAEVFIGSDFHDIKRYKEFEVSPQNEWVDLDINLSAPRHEHSARIDRSAHIWYAAMRIPLAALGTPAPAEGTAFRVNLFRTEGPPDDAKEITWRPPMSNTFHAPERFGLLRLVTH